MQTLEIKRTNFSVSDFFDWQRQGTLDLNPPFQRRSVWKPGAKSYLVDSVVRGLPTPVIFLRERIDLSSLSTVREVVDGQQRLRTLLTYIDPSVLPDFRPERDAFLVRKTHNPDLADKTFSELPPSLQARILGYEFSTHVLPTTSEDRDILQIFARLNATGLRLTDQELRNAEFFGEFKTSMYELAYEQLERWLEWRLFNEDAVSRMKEVELTSDLVANMMEGLSGKTQGRLRRFYLTYDDAFPNRNEVSRRFRRVMDQIDSLLGADISGTIYTSEMHFFTMFVFLYDKMYGLDSSVEVRREPKRVPERTRACLLDVNARVRSDRLPRRMIDATRGAATDLGRRRTRLEFMRSRCDASAGQPRRE